MKYVKLPYKFGEHFYEISPYTGALLQYESPKHEKSIPKKVLDALRICDNPYMINTDSNESTIVSPTFQSIRCLNKMHDWFHFIGNNWFYFSLLYSKIKKPLFENSCYAFNAIRNHIPLQLENKNEFCLQRSLLAIKTSRSFKKSGVLFIGASLPTGNMHAWIIESNKNPDIQDREWIMYKPMLAFYY
jgi:hypothetical protein